MEANLFRPKRDQRKAIKRVIMIAYDKIEVMEIQKKEQKRESDKGKNGKGSEKAKVAQLEQNVQNQLQKVCVAIVEYLKNNLGQLLKQAEVSDKVK